MTSRLSLRRDLTIMLGLSFSGAMVGLMALVVFAGVTP